MSHHRGKLVSLSLAALGAVVALVALVAYLRSDLWLLRRFRAGDRPAKVEIARRLFAMGSVRAVPEVLRTFLHDEILFPALVEQFVDAYRPCPASAIPVLEEALAGGSPPIRIAAIGALEKIAAQDASAVPGLIRALGDVEPILRRLAADALGRAGPRAEAATVPLAEALGSQDMILRTKAAPALKAIGPEARLALSDLLEAAERASRNDERELRMHAIEALRSIDLESTAVLPALAAALEKSEPAVRWRAAVLLRRTGLDARIEPRVLLACLRDPDPRMRVFAAHALEAVCPPPEALPVLTDALVDPERAVRSAVARALASLGPRAAGAVPALMEHLWDPSYQGKEYVEKVAPSAALALRRIGKPAVEPLLEAVLTGHYSAYHAGRALGRIPEGAQVIPSLVTALFEGSRYTADGAYRALYLLGPEAAPAIPVLIETLRSPDRRLAGTAEAILAGIGPAVVRPLIEELGKEDREDLRVNGTPHQMAISLLGSLGPQASEAIPTLVKLLGVRHLCVWAAEALGKFGPAAKEAVPALAELVRSSADRSWVRFQAAGALWRIDGRTGEAIEAAIGYLRHPGGGWPFACLPLLGEIGPPARPAVPIVLEYVKKQDVSFRTAAVKAIARIGEGEEEAAGILARALEEDGENWREINLRALTALGRRGSAAIPAVLRQLKQSSFRVGEHTAALLALSAGDPAIIPELTAIFEKFQDPTVRGLIAAELGMRGGAARAAVPALREALAASLEGGVLDGGLSAAAALALFRIEGKGEVLVPSLVIRLKNRWRPLESRDILDRNWDLAPSRQQAARVLREIGAPARKAIPVLLAALEERDDRFLVLECALTLLALGTDPARAAAPLARILDDEDYRFIGGWSALTDRPDAPVLIGVHTIMTASGEEDYRPYFKGLLERPADRSYRLHIAAAIALGEIGPPARAALPSLERARSSADGDLRRSAAWAMERIRGVSRS